MAFYVYLHTNNLDGKMYVGITSQDSPESRWGSDGRRYSREGYFGRAIEKYGWDNFSHEYWVVDSEEAMKQCEKDMIAFFDTKAPNGYNCTDGGDGSLGFHPSLESRKKISDSLKGENSPNYGKRQSKETVDKRRKSMYGKNKGKVRSEETVAKMRENNAGSGNPMYGKTQTDEARKKISVALSGENNPNYGTHQSEETKDKNRQRFKGRKQIIGPDGKRHWAPVEENTL